MKKFLILIPFLLAGCEQNPQVLARKQQERNTLFLQCVDLATRNNTQYRDNADVVEECRIAARNLI